MEIEYFFIETEFFYRNRFNRTQMRLNGDFVTETHKNDQ